MTFNVTLQIAKTNEEDIELFQIASELNAAILKMENQEYTNPKLCSLLRMILWSQSELDKHNVKYPKMTDLANATIEQPKWN